MAGLRGVVSYSVLGALFGWLLSACQAPPAGPVTSSHTKVEQRELSDRLSLDLPEAWGGQVRCGPQGCLLGVVEHERNAIVVHQLLPDRTSRFIASHKVPYHPDSAIWLSDDLLAAAVEDSGGVDIFRLSGGKLHKLQTIPAGFGPRDVVLVESEGGRYRMVATPYIGSDVTWMDWQVGGAEPAGVQRSRWCKSPWHPVKVSKLPQTAGGGLAVACLDDRSVVAVSGENWMAAPKVLAQFKVVPRQVKQSPSGRWLYVALETGERNARIDLQTGELQWIPASLEGSVSVEFLSEDLVIWGEDSRVRLQRIGAAGAVLESKELRTSGFSTSLQLLDIDGDQHMDLVVLNSAGARADVIFGPLWDKALQRP
ncbi:MAG TPA: hypothetical protein PLE22_00375 [Acidovorax sp.]|nr:hypothetical protein [Acidovorax sp.]